MPMMVEPILETSRTPFYTKLRAEAHHGHVSIAVAGQMYLGFHLDPLYRVHWNNEAPAMSYEIKADDGVTISPTQATGARPEEKADADPREFLVDVEADLPGKGFDITVRYYACDDALTFCIPVKQEYRVTMSRNTAHGWTMSTNPDGSVNWGTPPPLEEIL